MVYQFHNFHLPNEIRVFQIPEANIRVWNDKVIVYEVKIDNPVEGCLTFRHYSFYDKWFEINITLDQHGRLIDWSFNCDICTPCFSKETNIYGMDLELDILVGNNGRDYLIIDEDDFEHVVRLGLLTESERIGALKRFNGIDYDRKFNFIPGKYLSIFRFNSIV